MSDTKGTIPSDMVEALKEYERKARAIIQPFAANLDQEALPALIYHYTNDAGLLGILRTGSLWLSDIFDLNDPSELRHGRSQAARILKERVVERPRSSGVR